MAAMSNGLSSGTGDIVTSGEIGGDTGSVDVGDVNVDVPEQDGDDPPRTPAGPGLDPGDAAGEPAPEDGGGDAGGDTDQPRTPVGPGLDPGDEIKLRWG